MRKGKASQIVFDNPVATTAAYTVSTFHYTSDGKRVTGLVHLPSLRQAYQQFPVIVQFRGYVSREQYQPGVGTRRSAEVFARNGFISVAPDFLGYGGSILYYTDEADDKGKALRKKLADFERNYDLGHGDCAGYRVFPPSFIIAAGK